MISERLYKVLTAPVITEKATLVAGCGNQVVFRVLLDADKREVKKAVEALFKVRVMSVRTIRVKGKRKVNKYGNVCRSDWKKAYVRLEAGHEIDFASI